MPPVRSSPATTSRGAILSAALELFASRGYEATTIDDVRKASGASTGSVYHFFKGKEAVAAALFVEGLAGYQEELLAVFERYPDAREGVPAAVHHYFDWASRNPAMARFMLTNREPEVKVATAEPVAEMNRRFFAATTAWRARNIAAGRLRDLPYDVYLAALYGPIQFFVRLWLGGRTTTSAAAAVEAIASAAWRAVGGLDDQATGAGRQPPD